MSEEGRLKARRDRDAARIAAMMLGLARRGPLVACAIAIPLSMYVWSRLFRDSPISPLQVQLQTLYAVALFMFSYLSSQQMPTATQLLRILFKLVYTVWIALLVVVIGLDQPMWLEYTLSALLLPGYLEACFEIQAVIEGLRKGERLSDAAKILLSQSRRVSLLCISGVHIAAAYMLRAVLGRMVG